MSVSPFVHSSTQSPFIKLKPLDLHRRVGAGRADRVGQDVAKVLRAPLDGRRPVGVGQVLFDRVIARQ